MAKYCKLIYVPGHTGTHPENAEDVRLRPLFAFKNETFSKLMVSWLITLLPLIKSLSPC